MPPIGPDLWNVGEFNRRKRRKSSVSVEEPKLRQSKGEYFTSYVKICERVSTFIELCRFRGLVMVRRGKSNGRAQL
jgi:hypothetical protein